MGGRPEIVCGRYADPDEEDIVEAFDVQYVTGRKQSSDNVCPTGVIRFCVG